MKEIRRDPHPRRERKAALTRRGVSPGQIFVTTSHRGFCLTFVKKHFIGTRWSQEPGSCRSLGSSRAEPGNTAR